MDALDYIWKNPETGYKERKTHAYLEEARAKEIIAEYQPVFGSMQEYFDFVDKLAVSYEDGKMTLNFGG